MTDASALIYGAYGYTGELVARRAVESGIRPMLAGRRRDPLRELAADLDLPYCVCPLDGNLTGMLADVEVVAHCAGPFVDTSEPMVEACLATGTHYLDITGEIPVMAAVERRDEGAREAGVMLLSGAGFDVVPSDCLAARLSARLPSADRLTLVLDAGGMQASAGTLRTVIEGLDGGSAVREDGRVRSIPFGSRVREIDTGDGPREMVAVPWGDVSTAYHTTGIPNVAVYAPAPATARRLLGVVDALAPVLGSGPVKRLLQGLVDARVEGPGADVREEGSASFWGEATDGDRTVRGRVHTPESYRFTALSVVELLERILAGQAPTGYQTPASAYGQGLVLSIEGCSFEELD